MFGQWIFTLWWFCISNNNSNHRAIDLIRSLLHIITTTLWSRYYSPHFKDKNMRLRYLPKLTDTGMKGLRLESSGRTYPLHCPARSWQRMAKLPYPSTSSIRVSRFLCKLIITQLKIMLLLYCLSPWMDLDEILLCHLLLRINKV